MKNDAQIYMFRKDKEIPAPKVAYEGTSAAFDIACSETTTINPGEFKVVPTSIFLSIPQNQPYYMMIHLRSSLGFKYGLRCHTGIVDAGYTGDFGVSVVNNTSEPYTINRGDYFAQILVCEKPKFHFIDLDEQEWETYKNTQIRGDKGFGSSNNQ